MKQTDTMYTAITAGSIASVTYLVGGVDNLIVALGIFMISDFVLGMMAATEKGEKITWSAAFKGIRKKVAVIAFIVLTNQLDLIWASYSTASQIIGQTGAHTLRNSMILISIGLEGISVKENAQVLGYKLPSFVSDILDKLAKKQPSDQADNKNTNNKDGVQ